MAKAKASQVRAAPELSPEELALQSYRFAAAVLSTFNSEALRPLDSRYDNDGDAVLDLLEECERVQTVTEGWQWTLRNSLRRPTLMALGERRAIQRALQVNAPRPQDALQRMFDAVIEEQLPPLEQQSVEELTASLQVIDWLEGVINGLPDRQAVIDRLEWQQLTHPFRQLVGEHFRGRGDELGRLHRFLEEVQPQRSIYQSRPLMVYGAGGVGKSTLLAKFILETIDEARVRNFAFVYWDFDRVVLLPEEPVTLLAELVRQLGLQLLPIKPMARDLRQQWLTQLAQSAAGRSAKSAQGMGVKGAYREAAKRAIAQGHENLLHSLYELRRLVTELPQAHELRLLLVLDTFERVQELSFDFTVALWDFLSELQALFPFMRVIVSGRAQLNEQIAHEPFELKELDEEATKGYLAFRGVTHPQVAAAIYRLVGGDPLSLRLTLDALEQEQAEKHQDIASLTELPPDFDELTIDHELNQGWLYRRYLGRIRDPEIQRLAHPGLTLRRVTPPLIREVLAVPCHVDVPSDEVANDLFGRLAQQASLVTFEGPRLLRHRPDIRKRMLRPLIQTEGDAVFEIHRRAVDFYTRQPATPEARAEEIYHRLFLAQPREEIDARWIEGVVTLLRDAVDEIPTERRGYLISKLGTTTGGIEFDWNEADAQSKEEFVATRAQDALAVNKPTEALQLLSEIRDRLPGSKLFRLEAQTLEMLGRYPEARIVANEGLFSALKAGDVDLELDLLFVALRANEKLGHFGRAAKLLESIAALDVTLEPPQQEWLAFEILMHRLRLCRLDPDECAPEPSTIAQAHNALQARFDADSRPNPGLLLDMVEEIGVEQPEAIQRAVAVFSSTFTAEAGQRQLAALLREWIRAPGKQHKQSVSTLASVAQLLDAGQPEQAMAALEAPRSDDWPDFFQRLFALHAPAQSFVSGLVTLLRGSPATGSQPGTLTAALLDQVARGLFNSFETHDSLMTFLQAEFPDEVGKLPAGDSTYNNTLLSVATLFERQGKTEALIDRVLKQQPDNEALRALQQQLAVAGGEKGATDVTDAGSVNVPGNFAGTISAYGSTVNIGGSFTGTILTVNRSMPREELDALPKTMPLNSLDPIGPVWAAPELIFNWALGMRQAMRAVCKVEAAETICTGFLVAPDLLLIPSWITTREADRRNWEQGIKQARFDDLEAPNGAAGAPTVYRFADDWLVAMNDTGFGIEYGTSLGYMLARLKDSPGDDLVPGENLVRGWLSLTPEPVTPGRSLAMLHHVEGGPQKLEFAQAQAGADGDLRIDLFSRFRANGAAGAPCFNERWQVVAIRHGLKDYQPPKEQKQHVPGRTLIALWARDLLADPIFVAALKQHLPEVDLTPEDKAARLNRLQAILNDVFTFEELQSLAFDLGVNRDNLQGETRSEKALALLDYMESHDQLDALIQRVAVLRPQVNWHTQQPRAPRSQAGPDELE